MAEFCGQLHSYSCSMDNAADFTVIADKDGVFMPGTKVLCEGFLPHFDRKTPLVLSGKMDSSGVFMVENFHLSTSSSALCGFLRDTKTIPVRLCRELADSFHGDFSWALNGSAESFFAGSRILSEEQSRNAAALFGSCAAILQLWNGFSQMGLTCLQIDTLYEKYGLQTQMQVSRHPYLCASMAGLDLEQGDRLALFTSPHAETFSVYAKHCQPRMDFVIRLAAGLIEQNGDCYTTLQELERILRKYTSSGLFGMMDADLLLSAALSGSIFRPVVEDGELRIYLSVYYQKEQETAMELRRLCSVKQQPVEIDPDDISKYDKEQKSAILGCLGPDCVTVITGGPGTGKTTVLKAVAAAAEQSGLSVSLCAPTGRAAARLSESTKRPASTIHRMLGIRSIAGREPSAVYNAQNPLPSGVIIVDEASMISLELFCSLLCAVRNGGRLILVGDPDQLPSVSPGRVLEDIVESGRIPVFRLKTIHRQAGGSSIVDNAYRILQSGKDEILPLASDRQFDIRHAADAEEALSLALQIFTDEYDIKDPYRLQILTPSRKGPAGKDQINQCIIENLPGRLCPRKGFAKYDKVMTIHNCYDEESAYMNGDIGVVSDISEGGIFLSGAARKHTFVRNLRDIDYAYASTTHKAQGSEYDHVVIVLDTEYPGMLYKGLLYTAVTRAKKKVTLIYVGDALTRAITKESPSRRSGLAIRIRKS